MSTFNLNFVLAAYLKQNVFDFSVDCNTIDISDILNTHNYLLVKNNIK